MKENTDERCGAETRDGSPCQKWPVDGAGEGRCRLHGGASTGPDDPPTEHLKNNNHATGNDGGAEVGNGRAESHGLTADRRKWFDRHREEVKEWVRILVASYLEDAPFGWRDTAKVDQLCEVAIDQARLRESNEYLDEFLVEQTTAVTDDGEEVIQLRENPGHLPRDRIKRTNSKRLKELSVLDEPESHRAESTTTLAEVIDS